MTTRLPVGCIVEPGLAEEDFSTVIFPDQDLYMLFLLGSLPRVDGALSSVTSPIETSLHSEPQRNIHMFDINSIADGLSKLAPLIPVASIILATIFIAGPSKQLASLPENSIFSQKLWKEDGTPDEDLAWSKVDLESRIYSKFNLRASQPWIWTAIVYIFTLVFCAIALNSFRDDIKEKREASESIESLGGFFRTGADVADIVPSLLQILVFSIFGSILFCVARTMAVKSEIRRREVYLEKALAERPREENWSKLRVKYVEKINQMLISACSWNPSAGKNWKILLVHFTLLVSFPALSTITVFLGYAPNPENGFNGVENFWAALIMISSALMAIGAFSYIMYIVYTQMMISRPKYRIESIVSDVDDDSVTPDGVSNRGE